MLYKAEYSIEGVDKFFEAENDCEAYKIAYAMEKKDIELFSLYEIDKDHNIIRNTCYMEKWGD